MKKGLHILVLVAFLAACSEKTTEKDPSDPMEDPSGPVEDPSDKETETCACLKISVRGSIKLTDIDIIAPNGKNLADSESFSDQFASPCELSPFSYTDFCADVSPSDAAVGSYALVFTDSDGDTFKRTFSLEEDAVAGETTSLGSFNFSRNDWVSATASSEASVTDVKVTSTGMNRTVNVKYIVPDSGPDGARYPVVYLLHGHGAAPDHWLNNRPDLKRMANTKGIIMVCPDGSYSWYIDSPVKSDFKYETFISEELVKYTDENYPTIPDRSARAITGYSMGGHGAFWNAIRNKDVFGAAGAMSGGVDFSYNSGWADSWHLKDILGDRASNLSVWQANTVMSQVGGLNDGDLAMIMDCGTEDFFYTVNQNLHDRLVSLGISHDYSTRAGAHDWNFWKVSVDMHMDFCENYFYPLGKASSSLPGIDDLIESK